MIKSTLRHAVPLVAIVIVTGVFSALVHGGESTRERTPVVTDTAAGPGDRSRVASTNFNGKPAAVLRYRNKAGDECMAFGQPVGSGVGVETRRGALEMPLDQGGTCGLNVDPVSLQIVHTREEVLVYGVAASDVSRLVLRDARGEVAGRPADDDAFVISFGRAAVGRMSLLVDRVGGASEIELPELPDLDRITEDARRNAPVKVGPPQG